MQVSKFWMFGIFALLCLALVSAPASAQDGGNGDPGGGDGGGGDGGGGDGGDGDGGGDTNELNPGAGVLIDAKGVLKTRMLQQMDERTARQLIQAARTNLNEDLMVPSDLRKVSLKRLEQAVAKCVQAGQPIPEDMLYLAGLTRVTHVFYVPQLQDIIIAGPAEGFFADVNGKVVGIDSRKVTLQLQDLIVAMRAFPPTGEQTDMIGVSIDPTTEGLKQFNETVKQVFERIQPVMQQQGGGLSNLQIAQIAQTFKNALGHQTVTIKGVSPQTNFAQVLVEADYRMKLIGIGLEQPPVRITTFIEKVGPTGLGRNALQRWYFVPDYDCVEVNGDETAMRLVGGGVKLVGESEVVNGEGERSQTGRDSGPSRAFTTSFTRNYNKLADKAPVYGELRNLVDLSIVAAFIQEMDLFAKAEWDMAFFGSENAIPVEVFRTPETVEPAINALFKGRTFMTPIGGGVSIHPRVALDSDKIKQDDSGEIDAALDSLVGELSDDQWWWD